MTPYAAVTTDLSLARRFIAAGRVVAFPSGTSYGLAADATQGHALQRLRILKGRPQEKSFTVMLAHELWSHYLSLTDCETRFINQVGSQPLTILVKPGPLLAHLAQNGLIGLRLIDHPLMDQLCQITRVPLTATSANRTGEPPCFTPHCIQTAFPGLLPDHQLDESDPRGASGTTYNLSLACVLDGGVLPPSQPTTIMRLTTAGNFDIIRRGAISKSALQKYVSQTSQPAP